MGQIHTQELIAYLGTVPVGDADVVIQVNKMHDPVQAFPRPCELLGNGTRFIFWRQGIAAQGYHQGPLGTHARSRGMVRQRGPPRPRGSSALAMVITNC